MICFGTVQNGTIVLDDGVQIPDGTKVQVTPVNEAGEELTLIGLFEIAGSMNDLPSDFAAEHDHYIHGTPKRNRNG